MNIWHDINKKRVKPELFTACIEISKGSKKKYELDKETGHLMLDRILYTSTHYPANYGFIPLTYASDYDPLDVLVLCSEDLEPLALVDCKPIGIISMIDSDQVDDKIIAVVVGDPSLSHYEELQDLPKHVIDEMHHFFEVYKALEGIQTYVLNTGDREKAMQTIEQAMKSYEKEFKK
ncbi:MAG: inorganic diphosphatase [Acholeplasmatales bacterium]